MKSDKTAPKPDDIELHPDAWDRFVDAVKKVARRPIRQSEVKGKPAKPKPRSKHRGASRA